jgi:N-acetyl-gamma-glutamyl-phosphate reductase
VDEVFPRLGLRQTYVPFDDRAEVGEVAFVCYPHAQAHPVVGRLLERGARVVDLSADFRLRDPALYPLWYDFDHPSTPLLAEAVYGLPEAYREAVARTRLVANPGCFPTGMLLGLMPLARRGALPPRVLVDAKSGVSGAGRTPTEKTHFSQVHDNFGAYSEVGHRHTPEMAQELTRFAGRPVKVSFTPHLLPVDRGILSTIYLPLEEQTAWTEESLYDLYDQAYAAEPFVQVVRRTPSLHEVQRTNTCRLALRVDEAAGVIKVIAAIDNLMKGASGQAVQNMNLMFGFPETAGLEGGL